MRLEPLARLAPLSAALTPQDIGQALQSEVLNEADAQGLSLGLVSADGSRLEWITMSGYPAAMTQAFGNGVSLDVRTAATDSVRSGKQIEIQTATEYAAVYPKPHSGCWAAALRR